MHLFSLDKKRIVVQHRLNNDKIKEFWEKNNIPKEQVVQELQFDLYKKFLQNVTKLIPTTMTPSPDTNEEIYTLEGYALSPLTLMELIQELIELDEVDRNKLLEEVTRAITYRPNKAKDYGNS